MNFLLDASLFDGPPPVQLVALVLLAVEGRHRIEVGPDARDGFVAWADTLGEVRGAILDEEGRSARDNAIRESGISITVMTRERSSWSMLRLTVEDALCLAYKPFRVLLENGLSDRRFLLAILPPKDREWIAKRVESEWVELEECGGIRELKKRVKWALQEQNVFRCAALFDGDAVELPAEQPESDRSFRARLGPASRTVLDLCEREPTDGTAGLVHHVLRRRAIENYLPDSALDSWAKAKAGAQRRTREKTVKALRRCDHRFHYNMKHGYAGDRNRTPRVSWLPDARNLPLEQGFGPDISSRFEELSLEDFDSDARSELRHFTTELLRRIR